MRPFAVRLLGAVALCLSLAGTAAADETAPVRAMSLREALEYARAHQPDLRESLARIHAADEATETARSRWYPVIVGSAQLVGSTTNNTTGSYLPAPGFDNPRVSATRAESSSTATFAPRGASLVGLNLRQEVFDFGRIQLETTAAELRADVTRADAATTQIYIDYGVESAYYAVYAAKGILDAADRAHDRALVHRDFAKAGVETGLRRPIELTRAEAVLDRYELERIRGRRGVIAAESALAAQVGVPDRLLDITEAVNVAPPALPPVETVLAEASARNPELKAALARIRAEDEATRAIAAQTRPNLYLSSTISGNAGGAQPSSGEIPTGHGLLPDVPNWDVGLVLSWPLFDRSVTTRAREARADADAAREHAASVRIKLTALVEQAYNDVSAARDALPVLRHAVQAAIANYEQANGRFAAGVGDAVELADAEELRVQADIQLALGTFELSRAQAALARAAAEGVEGRQR